MAVLVLNAGSSSLKISAVEPSDRTTLATASVGWGADATREQDRDTGLRDALAALAADGVGLDAIEAVGHRVVHGGARFGEPMRLDAGTVEVLDELRELAPLHNGVAAATIRAALTSIPSVPHVAVFDTAFHRSLPEAEIVYPLPWAWYADHGIRRYGFHGLSVAWSTRRAGELLATPEASLSLVVAHLGSGCSVTAVHRGRSAATSMGMTPLEGLMMGTRSGSVDPGALLAAVRDRLVVDPEALGETLAHASGLLGVSGVSGDMREVRQAADAGDPRAVLARTMFVARAASAIAAAATALPRLDGLVFTGGIGEHDADVRAAITERLAVLGVPGVGATDHADDATDEDAILQASPGGVAVLRVTAREDLVIANEVSALLRR